MHDVLRRGMYQEVLEINEACGDCLCRYDRTLLVALKISNSYSRIILYGTSALHGLGLRASAESTKKLLQKRIKLREKGAPC